MNLEVLKNPDTGKGLKTDIPAIPLFSVSSSNAVFPYVALSKYGQAHAAMSIYPSCH